MQYKVLWASMATVICFGSLALVVGTGCAHVANLIYAVKGNTVPAEYDGFDGKRVAILCSTDSGLSNDATAALLSRYVQATLENKVKEIEVVKQEEVEQWLDVHGWTKSDYYEIGKGVKADQVLAIDLMNLSLRDGATLYRGKADISVKVYDVSQEDKILYSKNIPEFSFPKIGGSPVTDSSEAKFRGVFVTIVSQKIASLFYAAEANADYALDATVSSF